jgi:alpha-methylacyl-CoA racemase
MAGPLAGLRIVELAGLGPGPFACMVLSDLGADIVRVVRPGGPDPLDSVQRVLTRGRTTVEADLKQEDGRELVLALCDRADALIEGFRPGVTERLGLGPEVVLRRNPRLVYGRVTGYGQDGPLAAAVGHDINYIAIAGVLGAIRRGNDAPSVPLNLIGDYGGGGMLLAVGVLAAIVAARAGGEGQVVDAAMVDGAALLATLIHGLRADGNWEGAPGANLLDGGAHFYRTYETADGGFMAVGAVEPQFYAELLRVLDLPPDDVPQWERERWPELAARLGEAFRLRSRDEWTAAFEHVDACVTPVLDLHEAARHPHNAARRRPDDPPEPLPVIAPRFDRTPASVSPESAVTPAEALARWSS